jgi:hypothetical protein
MYVQHEGPGSSPMISTAAFQLDPDPAVEVFVLQPAEAV